MSDSRSSDDKGLFDDAGPHARYVAMMLLGVALLAHLLTFAHPPAAPYFLWSSLVPGFGWMLLRQAIGRRRARKEKGGANAQRADATSTPTRSQTPGAVGLIVFYICVLVPYFLFCLSQGGPKGHQEIEGDRCKIVRSGVTQVEVSVERCSEYDNARTRAYSVIAILFALQLPGQLRAPVAKDAIGR